MTRAKLLLPAPKPRPPINWPLVLAWLAAVLTLTVAAWLVGRSQESQLAIDAYRAADRATELLRAYVPVAEAALAQCTMVDSQQMAALAVWERRIGFALVASAEVAK